ncbi:hypothetical protein BDF14DRAFT_836145 [Spinellus fusiger]|nr:hypothetical protein BDF14DRAFT_836145 [Spinellus fusiger]
MNIADMLNPSYTVADDAYSSHQTCFQLTSPPHSPISKPKERSLSLSSAHMSGKARSRFSALEDSIICNGVANGLTWGQISRQLPHRKRATCFNRYRTLQGIRKSRKSLLLLDCSDSTLSRHYGRPSLSPPSLASEMPSSPSTLSAWLPVTPPSGAFEEHELLSMKKDPMEFSQRSLFSDLGSDHLPIAPRPLRPHHRRMSGQNTAHTFLSRPHILPPFSSFPTQKHTSPPASPSPYYRRFSS